MSFPYTLHYSIEGIYFPDEAFWTESEAISKLAILAVEYRYNLKASIRLNGDDYLGGRWLERWIWWVCEGRAIGQSSRA